MHSSLYCHSSSCKTFVFGEGREEPWVTFNACQTGKQRGTWSESRLSWGLQVMAETKAQVQI